MPTWVRGEETASIIAPFPQKLAIAALGNSGSTGEAGLEAEIVYFPTIDDLRAAPDGCLKGKIAFVGSNAEVARYESGAGRIVDLGGKTVVPGFAAVGSGAPL